MITKEQVIPLLLDACPSFQAAWDECRQDYGEELLYPALGIFADHLHRLHRQQQSEVLHAVARAIERLHLEGDRYVREAATIGLLEGIQNVWGNSGTDPELFSRYLLPESIKWWQSLNEFWSGKIRFVGEGL